MQIKIIAVGKIKEKYLKDGIAEYEKRLRPYMKLQILELAEEKRPTPSPDSAETIVKRKEGERILAAIPSGSLVIALDPRGAGWSSEELAEAFWRWEISGKGPLTFVIGGDLGLSQPVLEKSEMRLSLSRMTFTHQMARLILLEQIYRAERINHGEPYHK